jgi:hypothetical protein
MNECDSKNLVLLVVVLVDDTFLDDLLLAMTGICSSTVTVIDGVFASENLAQIPLFAQLMGTGRGRACRVVFAATGVADPVQNLLDLLKKAKIDFMKRGLGDIFTIGLEHLATSGPDTSCMY